MATATTSHTGLGADDNGQSTEEPREWKSFTLGSGEAGGGATRLLTLTYIAFFIAPYLTVTIINRYSFLILKFGNVSQVYYRF